MCCYSLLFQYLQKFYTYNNFVTTMYTACQMDAYVETFMGNTANIDKDIK